MRVLVTGWPSFLHGEATAGDVLSMRRVRDALDAIGIACDTVWSHGFLPGAAGLDDVDPSSYSHLVFACGPVTGSQVAELHERFPCCYRIAVGVSVIDPACPAASGFHRILPRDGGAACAPDLADPTTARPVPVAGVVLAPGQREYGSHGRHEDVHRVLGDWLGTLDCALLELDSRLDTTDWRHCSTPDQFAAVLSRLDVVITTRLHGLVLAVRSGVPAIAVDPIDGGGKVTAQARALSWPAILAADEVCPERLDAWFRWCRSDQAAAKLRVPECEPELIDGLVGALRLERAA
ncbi:MAG: polysaccharide pyruvyl transferase family protein [Actinophytocola sp.]|nr:polysaccharide pyruvyl transferase family protein [Actinophytocola sp.]